MSIITKDGKDDGAVRNFFRTIEDVDPDNLLPEEIRESRHLTQVTLVGSEELSREERRKSEGYWEQASLYGLVDSIIRPPDRETVVVLSVSEKDEAERLVQNDPMVSDGKVRPRWAGEMQWIDDTREKR